MADSTYKMIVTSSKPRISHLMSHFLDMPNPRVTCHLAHNTASWKKGHNVHLGGIAIEGGCVCQVRPVTRACQRVDFAHPAKSTGASRRTARIGDIVDWSDVTRHWRINTFKHVALQEGTGAIVYIERVTLPVGEQVVTGLDRESYSVTEILLVSLSSIYEIYDKVTGILTG